MTEGTATNKADGGRPSVDWFLAAHFAKGMVMGTAWPGLVMVPPPLRCVEQVPASGLAAALQDMVAARPAAVPPAALTVVEEGMQVMI